MSEVKVLHEWVSKRGIPVRVEEGLAGPCFASYRKSLVDGSQRWVSYMSGAEATEMARLAARVAALEAGLRDAMQYFTDANSKREAWGPMVERWRQLLEGTK